MYKLHMMGAMVGLLSLPVMAATTEKIPTANTMVQETSLHSRWSKCREDNSLFHCIFNPGSGNHNHPGGIGDDDVPPPPPPPPVCDSGPYIVFFEWDKADISPEAALTLDHAVATYGGCGLVKVMLAGHTDTTRSDAFNLELSRRMNSSVQAYLESRGIPASAISSEAFGESRPRVETEDNVREQQNRRVEIMFGPETGD